MPSGLFHVLIPLSDLSRSSRSISPTERSAKSVQLRLELLKDRGRLMAGGAFRRANDELFERVDPGAHVAEPRVEQPRLLPQLGEIGRQELHRLDGAQRTLVPAGL